MSYRPADKLLGINMSVSKPNSASSQHSCTALPSPPSEGCRVSCPTGIVCCLAVVLLRSVKDVIICLQCVSFCVGNGFQPFQSVPLAPALGQCCLVLPFPKGSCSTES